MSLKDYLGYNPKLNILNITGAFIAVGLITILGFCTYALVYEPIPDKNENALLILIGVLSTNVSTIISFFFGSSLANKQQQDTISDALVVAKTSTTQGTSDAGKIP